MYGKSSKVEKVLPVGGGNAEFLWFYDMVRIWFILHVGGKKIILMVKYIVGQWN